jgi:phospholipid/cholesterol/gamma-HCH transport system substrate-binding protein
MPAAKLVLSVDPKYLNLIPSNVTAKITASTVFGNKYVSFTSPKNPTPQRITPTDQIDATSVTTEANTLFQTITSITEKVDPVEVNLTLSAAAEALTGLGDKFGQSIVNGNSILNTVNPKMPQIRHDIQRLADLSNTYANASPDLFDFLNNALTTARTFNKQQHELDAALLSAVGFGNTAADVIDRARPNLIGAAAELIPTAELLDEHSPALVCTLRNWHDVYPKYNLSEGGNGYSLRAQSELIGPPNPYVYPDNLPRVNARGGPGGKPGCWQPITPQLWPAPTLVKDVGASVAPYNHFEISQPLLTEYVWGRQFGENTINP